MESLPTITMETKGQVGTRILVEFSFEQDKILHQKSRLLQRETPKMEIPKNRYSIWNSNITNRLFTQTMNYGDVLETILKHCCLLIKFSGNQKCQKQPSYFPSQKGLSIRFIMMVRSFTIINCRVFGKMFQRNGMQI